MLGVFEELIEDGVNGFFIWKLKFLKIIDLCFRKIQNSITYIEYINSKKTLSKQAIKFSVENMENSIYESFISEFKKFPLMCGISRT